MTQELIPLEQVGARRAGKHGGGLPQKYTLDEHGRRLLLARYDGKSETISELAHLLRVPRWKVTHWAGELGLARQREPRWTQDEIAYLETHLHIQSLNAIAKQLGRTKTAVQLKAKRLGINKCYQEGYTMRALCMGLGCDHHKVKRWLDKGWLKGCKRGSEFAHDCWFFSDKDIRNLVRWHPQEIDPRRADWLWLVDILLGADEGLGELVNMRGRREGP